MARTKGTFNISANIEPNAAAPLDAREKVPTKADLTASGTFPYFYEGMEVYVVEEHKRYTLKGNDPTVLANWEENGSGGGSVTIDDELSSTSENPVQNKAIKAGLDGKADLVDGKIPANQLPSYVDQINEGYLYNGEFYEDSQHQTQYAHESDKIYIDVVTNKAYRWGGSAYATISESLALGETSSTAYRGDRGKIAYDDSQTNKTAIGTLANLLTTAKTNLVAAINELFSGKQKNITAGSGISKTTGTTTDTIAVDAMPSADMSEIIDPLPGITPKWHTYSTEEQVIGTWIDGKTIYEKTIDCGAGPNSTEKTVAHGISNLDKIIDFRGFEYSTNYFGPIPMVDISTSGTTNYQLGVKANNTNLILCARYNASSVNVYITIQYTKS